MKRASEQPPTAPHPADVEQAHVAHVIERTVDILIEQHRRATRVRVMGQKRYDAAFSAMFPEDEWTRTRGGR